MWNDVVCLHLKIWNYRSQRHLHKLNFPRSVNVFLRRSETSIETLLEGNCMRNWMVQTIFTKFVCKLGFSFQNWLNFLCVIDCRSHVFHLNFCQTGSYISAPYTDHKKCTSCAILNKPKVILASLDLLRKKVQNSSPIHTILWKSIWISFYTQRLLMT